MIKYMRFMIKSINRTFEHAAVPIEDGGYKEYVYSR